MPTTHPEDSFEAKVLVALAELNKDMKSIVGNGKKGRLDIVEEQTSRNTRYINITIGVGLCLTVIVGALKLFV
jgi:hypothetical protein